MINEYTLCEKKGRGSFGSVYRALNRNGISNLELIGQEVAMKKMKRHRAEQYLDQTTVREVIALNQLRDSEYVVQLQEVIFTDKKVYLVFPFYQMNLHDYIKRKELKDYKTIFKQLLLGLQNIHRCGYIHRDLKPLNILMDPEGVPYIADFGMVRQYFGQSQMYVASIERFTYEVATLHYRAPENLLGFESYDYGMDIWSMGCIFSQIVNGHVLFQADTQIEMLFKIFEKLGTPSGFIAPELAKIPLFQKSIASFPVFFPSRFLYGSEYIQKIGYAGSDLIRQMLQLDPKQRITVDEALQHIFFL